MLVSKWGDSLAVRLPNALVEKMGLRAGDELNIVWSCRSKTGARLRSNAWPPSTGRFLPITNSIGTRPTTGEGVFRYQHA